MNPAQKVLDAAQDASEAYNKLELRLERANAEIVKIRKMAHHASLADRSKADYSEDDVVVYCMKMTQQ